MRPNPSPLEIRLWLAVVAQAVGGSGSACARTGAASGGVRYYQSLYQVCGRPHGAVAWPQGPQPRPDRRCAQADDQGRAGGRPLGPQSRPLRAPASQRQGTILTTGHLQPAESEPSTFRRSTTSFRMDGVIQIRSRWTADYRAPPLPLKLAEMHATTRIVRYVCGRMRSYGPARMVLFVYARCNLCVHPFIGGWPHQLWLPQFICLCVHTPIAVCFHPRVWP